MKWSWKEVNIQSTSTIFNILIRQHGEQQRASWVACWKELLLLRCTEKEQQRLGFSVIMCWTTGKIFIKSFMDLWLTNLQMFLDRNVFLVPCVYIYWLVMDALRFIIGFCSTIRVLFCFFSYWFFLIFGCNSALSLTDVELQCQAAAALNLPLSRLDLNIEEFRKLFQVSGICWICLNSKDLM